jgi:hypothetical protein
VQFRQRRRTGMDIYRYPPFMIEDTTTQCFLTE